MSEQVIKTIEAILKRGNDVEIRRKGDGYIVLEDKRQSNTAPDEMASDNLRLMTKGQ